MVLEASASLHVEQDDGGRAPAEGADCAVVGMVRNVIPHLAEEKEGPAQPPSSMEEQGHCRYLSPHPERWQLPLSS